MGSERQKRFCSKAPWAGASGIESASYVCGYCENLVASHTGYQTQSQPSMTVRHLRACPHCNGMTVFGIDGSTFPAPLPGKAVGNLPPLVETIYGEARAALSADAPTAAALLFRTLLMHVACHLGALPGKKFVEYVDHLEATHHVPPTGKDWLDHIRKQGNLATHELVAIPKAEAEELLTFIAMLLELVFDFPARLPKKT